MYKKIIGSLILFVLFICIFTKKVEAEESTVACCKGNDSSFFVYVREKSTVIDARAIFENGDCDDIQKAKVSTMSIPIKTLILFDDSDSMGKFGTEELKIFLKGIVLNHNDKEAFKILTFSDYVNGMDYSSDYDNLIEYVDGIEFVQHDFDYEEIMYEVIKNEEEKSEPNLTRIIVITDCGKKNNSDIYGKLMEEIFNSEFVIHTVGIMGEQEESFDDLFSYARCAGGTHYLAYDKDMLEEAINYEKSDYEMICIKVNPQNELKDGSLQHMELVLENESEQEKFELEVQMPYMDNYQQGLDMVDDESKKMENDNTADNKPLQVIGNDEENSKPLPVIGNSSNSGESPKRSINLGFVLIIFVVILCLVSGIILIVLLKKKRTQKKKSKKEVVEFVKNQEKKTNNTDSSSSIKNKKSGETIVFDFEMKQEEREYLILTDITDENKKFKAALKDSVIIGRTDGHINIEYDFAVSKRHCKITKSGDMYYIEDLNSSNGTKYDNMRISGEVPFTPGKVLYLGRGAYRVTIESM